MNAQRKVKRTPQTHPGAKRYTPKPKPGVRLGKVALVPTASSAAVYVTVSLPKEPWAK